MSGAGPFTALAEWLMAALPPRLLGVGVISPSDPPGGQLPPRRVLRLDLPESAMLIRRVSVPASADTRRRAALIEMQLDEISPWVAGEFLWDSRPAPDDPASVDLAMMPLTPIRETEERIERTGRRLGEVRGATEDGRVFLLRRDERGLGRVRAALIGLWAAALFVALALAVVSVLRMQASRTAADLAGQQLDLIRQKVASVAGGQSDIVAIAGTKTDAASPVHLLDNLAAQLPDGAWLLSATIENGHFEMTGKAATPEAIIPSLQESDAFADVNFAGSSTLDPENGVYSFSVKGESRDGQK